jgi:hypothetical protein
VWLQVVVSDFDHDVYVVLATLRQHGLRPLAVAEDAEVFQALIDHAQWQASAGAQ